MKSILNNFAKLFRNSKPTPNNTNLATLAESIDSLGLSYLGKEALYDLGVTMKYLNDKSVPGDVIECGCALGGSAIILAATKGQRHLSLFDVFGLIPPPLIATTAKCIRDTRLSPRAAQKD